MKEKAGSSHSKMQEQLPEIMNAFSKLREAATKEGALSTKEKELILLGISVALKCEPCIRAHMKKAIDRGVSRQEILEAIGLAILMSGGPGVAYGATALEVLDELHKQAS